MEPHFQLPAEMPLSNSSKSRSFEHWNNLQYTSRQMLLI